ncbi:Exonuclease mut-7 [Mortierella alpina]|nr:Exonuclease mut-7 [Mortierella alpina]
MLLKEIAARKNPLQVFVALDVFDMRPCLMRPLDGKQRTSDTYGSTLAYMLLAIDRLYEAAIVVSRFLCVRSATLDLELLTRLLAIPDERQDKAMLVHEFVGEHLDTCRAVLQEIDLRLSMRLAQWSNDIEGGHRSMPSFSEMFKSPLTNGAESLSELMMQRVSITRTCVSLVEIAMSLAMRFQIEDQQYRYSGLAFFSRYCTVRTLLEYQGSSPEYEHPQLFPTTNVNSSEYAKRLTQYSFPRPWVLLPVILSTIKGDRMLQLLTIQHCIVERKDSAAANFIATKLGLGEYYQHSVTKKQNSPSQPAADTVQREEAPLEKTTPSTLITASKTTPLSQWLEPTSDQWRSPSTWPQSSATPAVSETHHWKSWFSLAHQQHHLRQQPQQQQQQQQQPVQKPRRAQSALPFYCLPVNTSVILVDDAAQLPQLWNSLWHSGVVGVDSEWRSTLDPLDLDLNRMRGGASVSATALIQLACDFDNRVYLLDVIALKQDYKERLVKILGNLFANPSVRKIAYDWQGDKTRLEITFPALKHTCYRMENLVDLRYVWLHYRIDNHNVPAESSTRSQRRNMTCNMLIKAMV